MHHQSLFVCYAEQLVVDLETGKSFGTDLLFLLLAHARPDIGIENVSPAGRFARIVGQDHSRTGLAGFFYNAGIRLVTLWGGNPQFEPEHASGIDPAVDHIVAIA